MPSTIREYFFEKLTLWKERTIGKDKLPSNGKICYTNGSKKGPLVAAEVYNSCRGCIPLDQYSTVMEAKMVAI